MASYSITSKGKELLERESSTGTKLIRVVDRVILTALNNHNSLEEEELDHEIALSWQRIGSPPPSKSDKRRALRRLWEGVLINSTEGDV